MQNAGTESYELSGKRAASDERRGWKRRRQCTGDFKHAVGCKLKRGCTLATKQLRFRAGNQAGAWSTAGITAASFCTHLADAGETKQLPRMPWTFEPWHNIDHLKCHAGRLSLRLTQRPACTIPRRTASHQRRLVQQWRLWCNEYVLCTVWCRAEALR